MCVCVCVDEGKKKHSLSVLDVMEAANTDAAVDLDNLKLLEVHTHTRTHTHTFTLLCYLGSNFVT